MSIRTHYLLRLLTEEGNFFFLVHYTQAVGMEAFPFYTQCLTEIPVLAHHFCQHQPNAYLNYLCFRNPIQN